MIVLYLLGMVLAVCSAYTKKKKLSFLSLIILLLLMTSVRDGNDVTNYYRNYYLDTNTIEWGILSEWLYSVLSFAARNIGLNFYWFKGLLIACSMMCIYKVTKKYNPNYGFILVNYYLYFIFIDCQQLKNFYAVTIWMIGIYVYICYGSKWRYVIGCIGAMGMHAAFGLYVILGFIKGKLSKRFVKWLGIGVFAVFLFFMINRNSIQVIANVISSLLNDETGRMNFYLNNRTNYGFLPPVLLYLFSLFVYKFGYRQINKDKSLEKCVSQDDVMVIDMKYKFIDFFYYANIVMIVAFPMCLFSLVFYRLLRNIYFVNLIVFSIISSEMRHTKKWLLFNTLILVCTIGWFVADVYIYYGVEETLDLIFKGVMFWISD